MSFPLGNFNPHAPIDQNALAKARALLSALPSVPAGGIKRVYLHWAVSGMCNDFPDYNVEARLASSDSGEWELKIETSPANNVAGLNDDPVASHTYMRNTGAVGIAITGMLNATPSDFGPYPTTVAGLTMLCAGAAALCAKYDVDVAGLSTDAPYAGEMNVLTHAEAGNAVGNPQQYSAYGPAPVGDGERWDLAAFVPGPASASTANVCGDALRELVRAYKVALAS